MNTMKRSAWLLCGILAAAAARPVIAGDMIADAAGKTGNFSTKLKGMSAEGEREAIAKRMSQTGYAKHDLNTTSYAIYVPKEAGKDGKYGLMVSQNFSQVGKPPASWEAVLDKYHLIWIGAEGVTDGSPALMRVGYTLDAVYNAENTWSIDMNRVYLFNCSKDHPGAEAALFYPDIFIGSINCSQMVWFRTVANTHMKGLDWNFAKMQKPASELTALAKTRRFVLVDRSEDRTTELDNDVASGGYIKDGYKDTKIISQKTNIATKYMEMPPDWFELALGYIDGGTPTTPSVPLTAAAGEVAAAPPPEAAPKPKPTTAEASTAPNGKAMPATKPAVPQMVVPPVNEAEVAEEKATKALNLAKSYWVAGQPAMAKTRLQKLIAEYPKTAAAKDAKTMIDQITAQQ